MLREFDIFREKRYFSSRWLHRLRNYVGRRIGLGNPEFGRAVPRVPRSVCEHWWWCCVWWWQGRQESSRRKERLEQLLFGSNALSRTFDFFMLLAITVSVLLFMLESVESVYWSLACVYTVLVCHRGM